MTARELFIKRLGKRKFDLLPDHWKETVRALDSTPKVVRKAGRRKKSS